LPCTLEFVFERPCGVGIHPEPFELFGRDGLWVFDWIAAHRSDECGRWNPAIKSGRADTQQDGGWDTELNCVPIDGLASPGIFLL
jgi:hypothetical protein